jgi:hypothetical protein
VDAQTGQNAGNFFYIANTDAKESNPDVAYDSSRHRFLVVWEEYTCGATIPQYCYYTIRGRLYYGSQQTGDNHAGDRFEVASKWTNMAAGNDLRDPAVAFNWFHGRWQVVYIHGNASTGVYRQVYGRMLTYSTTQPTPLGDRGGFEIRSYSSGGVGTPDVAWANASTTNFLATYTRYHDTDVDYITAAYLHGDWHGDGSQVYGVWRIAPLDWGPLTKSCGNPAVASDPQNDAFTILFEHAESDSAGANTIWGFRVKAKWDAGGTTIGSHFPVETALDIFAESHYQPDIAYSLASKEMYAVYHTYDTSANGKPNDRVYARAITGSDVGARVVVRGGGEELLQDPAVACNNGCCLAAWRERDEPGNWDIFGQQICSAMSAPTIDYITHSCGRSDPNEKVTFTSYFEDEDGADDIKLVYFILNKPVSYVDGVGLAYNLELNKMVMRNDANTGWMVGWAPGTGGDLSTSRAILHVSECSATKNGNRLTVRWVVTFKQPMSPRALNEHIVVVDFAHNHSGWQAVGTWGVGTVDSPPCVGGVSPSSGTSNVGDLYTLQTNLADYDDWTDVKIVYLLISPTPGWNNQAIYLAYNQDVNKVFLRNDNNSAWLGGYTPGSAHTIQNNNVTVDIANCQVAASGVNMWFGWALRPRTGFTGDKNIYVSATDSMNYYAWWRKLGTWKIQ